MNAHSAYRNLGYKVNRVEQACSEKSIPLQIVDILLGIVVFIVEKKYQERNNQKISISNLVKSDLIYRLLIENYNLDKFHKRILIYHWNNSNEIDKVNVSDYTGNFLLFKTQYDIKEMKRLNELMLKYPQNDTKFYREKMGYSTRQLRMIQGYINELLGKGRNSFI